MLLSIETKGWSGANISRLIVIVWWLYVWHLTGSYFQSSTLTTASKEYVMRVRANISHGNREVTTNGHTST